MRNPEESVRTALIKERHEKIRVVKIENPREERTPEDFKSHIFEAHGGQVLATRLHFSA